MDKLSEQIYDLYSRLRREAAEKGGDWNGADVVDIVGEWLDFLGLETDPNQPMTTETEFARSIARRIAMSSD